jgi:hypothetical protein
MMKCISLPVFTVAFNLSYIVFFVLDLPLFFYYPQTRQFTLSPLDARIAGPSMHWYGLLASSAIAGLAVALIIRDRWIPVVLLQKLWLAPILAMTIVVWQLRFFFA